MRIIDAKAEIIGGVIDAAAELSGQVIEANAELVNEIRATTFPDYTGEYNVTPTEEAQTLNTAETVLMENVTVDAIPADYVGSEVPRQSDLSVSGLTVTAGAGYYEEAVSETVTPNLQSASASYTPTESVQADTIVADLYHDGLSSVGITVGAVPPDYVGSDVPRRSTLSVSGATVSGAAGYYDETVSATVASGSAKTPATSITANPTISVGNDGKITASVSKTQSVTPTVQEGYVASGTAGNVTVSGTKTEQLSTQAGTTITPTTSEQTAVAAGKYTTGAVKVAAMPSGTEGTPVATKGAVSGHSVSVTPSVTNAAGYIAGGTKTGTAVTVAASELVSGTKSISANGTGIDVTNYAAVDVAVPGPALQTKSVTPTESAQAVTADAGYDGLEEVDVGAISSTYVGSGIPRKASSDLTVSGATVTAPAGYYEEAASKSVASGTAGTPSASKGAVSNHQVSVTPSVTNVSGYITGGTKTGTAVTVSASELVSGSETKTANGTYDVTNLAELVVNVSGGGGASNIVMGTFTTGATRNQTGSFSINYTGTGYPIALLVFVKGGAYNNTTSGDTTWYNSLNRYDCGWFSMIKARTTSAPTYTTSGADNYGTVAIIYKNSTSTATTYTRTSTMTANIYTSSSTNASAGTKSCVFKGNGKTVSYYIGNAGSSAIGLAPSTEFQYIAIYSS